MGLIHWHGNLFPYHFYLPKQITSCMKKNPSPRHLFILVVALLITPYTFAQKKTVDVCSDPSQDTVNFVNECQILVNRSPYTITQTEINDKEKLFKKCVHFTDNDNPDLTPLKLQAIDIVKTLYCEAENIRKIYDPTDKQCITGVWMIIGMENDRISYSFQPAVMRTVSNLDGRHTFRTVYKGHVYSYDGNDFYNDDAGWQRKQALYAQTVRIKHVENFATWHKRARFKTRKGSPKSTWRGDAREVFYSFQEILRFYTDNNTQEDVAGEFYSKAIYVNHSAAKFTSVPKGLNFWRVKHNTFITVDANTTPNKKDLAITSATTLKNTDPGANLAHVCPSRCNDLQYSGAQ
jgi:hypothetical protein